MNRSPLFYVAVGVAGVWIYHHFIMPVPGAKKS
jgi:uncharacterized membrane protein YuzA (DUF378 family)